MSTKTLRKRIAVVAVSALTAGVLSVASTPVANASAADTQAIDAVGQIYINAAANAGLTAAIGQCAISITALAADITTVNSTGTVLAVGAKIDFDTTTKGTGQLRITGPATFTATLAGVTGTISQDAKSIGFGDSTSTKVATLTVTGAGDITVTAYNSSTLGSGTALKTFSITGVTSCGEATTPVAANTIMEIASTAGNVSAGGATGDETLAYADKDYAEVIHIRIALRNQYKADITGASGVLTAESSNPNALLQFDGSGGNVGPTAFKTGSIIGQSGGIDLEVSQNTTLAPGLALNTTITFKWNGVVVGTKAVSILGAPVSILVDQADVTVGRSGTDNSGTFKFLVKDAAGNNLGDGATSLLASAAATGTLAGVTYAGIVSDVKTANGASGSTKGTGTFDCAAFAAGTSSGSQKVKIGFISGTTVVSSNEFTATCGSATVDTFTASMDKATYSPGEIATLTISAKDANGGIVSDAATIGTKFNQISIPGMTIIGSAISSADVFTSGAKTYKFRVDQAEGSFVAQVGVDAATDLTVKTIQYSIKSSAGTVTNAEVLKSIVSLIASINKQIQALQKLILRR